MSAYKEHYSGGKWRKCRAEEGECPVHEGDGETVPHISADSKEDLAVKREAAMDRIMQQEGFGTLTTARKTGQYDYTNASSYVASVFSDSEVDDTDDEYISLSSSDGTGHLTIAKEDLTFSDTASDAERQELMRDTLARKLEEYDADSEMINANDGGQGSYQYLKNAQRFEAELHGKSREIRGLSPLPSQETEPEVPDVSLDESTLPDDEEAVSEENLSRFLEGAGLEGPNSEVTEEREMISEDDDVLTGYHVSVEAPNNATIGLAADPDMDMRDFNEAAIDYMGSFSAEEEFDTLWSRQFGEHNGFSASQFALKLEEDERYFHAVADKLHERSQNIPYRRDDQQFMTAREKRADYKDWLAEQYGRDE